MIRRKVRRVTAATTRISAETAGSLVLAAATSLLLAGALDQVTVSAGIAGFLIVFVAYALVAQIRTGGSWPTAREGVLLGSGIALGVVGPFFSRGGGNPTVPVTIAVAGGLFFAGATRRLLKSPHRILLAIGAAIPLAGQGLGAFGDPMYPSTIPWIVGVVAVMPWPAALAAAEVVRRQSIANLRRRLVRAERDMRGQYYERSLSEYDQAIDKARADVPGAEIPWYGKGATLILLGRYDEALRAIDKALDINPYNEVAWVNKGNALTKMGRLVDALRSFNAAIKVSPTYEVAWNNKGNALARMGKFEESLRCYEQALEVDPGYRGAWVNKGFVLAKLGRFDEAASCADRALILDPSRRAEPI